MILIWPKDLVEQCSMISIGAAIAIPKNEFLSNNVSWLVIQCGFCSSRGEARRLIEQGGLKSKLFYNCDVCTKSKIQEVCRGLSKVYPIGLLVVAGKKKRKLVLIAED